MRYLMVILVLLAISSALYGSEVSIGLDRCVILNHPTNQSAESMAAFYFYIPDSLSDKEIFYAELRFSIAFQTLNDTSLYEFMMYPAMDEWSAQTINFEEAEELADSMMTGSFTVRLSNLNAFRVDITKFVSEVLEGERTNYGLIAFTDLLGDANLRLASNLGNAIRNSASVRIIYK